MTHRPLTSLAISFPLLSIFRVHLTQLVVNTHRVPLLSVLSQTLQVFLKATRRIHSKKKKKTTLSAHALCLL